jgi:hypothetical protein
VLFSVPNGLTLAVSCHDDATRYLDDDERLALLAWRMDTNAIARLVAPPAALPTPDADSDSESESDDDDDDNVQPSSSATSSSARKQKVCRIS